MGIRYNEYVCLKCVTIKYQVICSMFKASDLFMYWDSLKSILWVFGILWLRSLDKRKLRWIILLAKWRSGSVSALPCERPGFASRTRLREIIPANNCTMQGQNNWGNWGSPDVMKLWVAWEVLRWLMKFRELCNGGFHPKLVTPPYHGFLNVNTPPNSQNSKRH